MIGRSVSKGSEVVGDVTKARIVLKKDKEGSFIQDIQTNKKVGNLNG